MNESHQVPERSDETYQEFPVQTFTCKAIPIVPGMVLAPRLGRPNRSYQDITQEGQGNAVTPPHPEAPPAGPTVAKQKK
jgi:hypothetical protein